MRVRRRIAAALALAIVLAAGYVLLHGHERQRIRIGTARMIISSPLMVAQELGYFRKHGLDVEVVSYPSGRSAMEALFKGDVDLATVAETPLWRSAVQDTPLVMWATLAETRSSLYLIARGDKDIRREEDLRGKRIGLPRGTTAEVYLLSLLDLTGLKRTDITLVDMPPQEIASAIKAGDIDAVAIWEPYASNIRSELEDPIIMHEDFLYRMTWNLVGNKSAADLPIESVLRAFDQVNQRMLVKDDKLISIIAEWCEMDAVSVSEKMPLHHFCLQLEGSLLMEVEQQSNLLNASNKAAPNFLSIINANPLLSVCPEAVSIPIHAAR
jgi:sulfonate transport system substrate-binding protein